MLLHGSVPGAELNQDTAGIGNILAVGRIVEPPPPGAHPATPHISPTRLGGNQDEAQTPGCDAGLCNRAGHDLLLRRGGTALSECDLTPTSCSTADGRRWRRHHKTVRNPG